MKGYKWTSLLGGSGIRAGHFPEASETSRRSRESHPHASDAPVQLSSKGRKLAHLGCSFPLLAPSEAPVLLFCLPPHLIALTCGQSCGAPSGICCGLIILPGLLLPAPRGCDRAAGCACPAVLGSAETEWGRPGL